MSLGLPLMSTYVNGMKDYTVDSKTGCCLKNLENYFKMTIAIRKMTDDKNFREYCGKFNIVQAKKFSLEKSLDNQLY
jgi:glycosyltransferase involved in cell wall biosynthesis